jgi:hypothetical protein
MGFTINITYHDKQVEPVECENVLVTETNLILKLRSNDAAGNEVTWTRVVPFTSFQYVDMDPKFPFPGDAQIAVPQQGPSGLV